MILILLYIVNKWKYTRNTSILYIIAPTDYTADMVRQVVSERKIRVLFVVESFSTGVYAIVKDIACNLDPNRYEVLIVHSLRADSPTSYNEDFAYRHITLRHVPMGSMSQYLSSIRKMRNIIFEYKPDAIHLHSSKAGFLGRVAAKGYSCATILYSPHGFSFLRTDVGPLFRWTFLKLEQGIHRYVPAKIIAVSPGEAQEAKKITQDVVTINNFIDTRQIPLVSRSKEKVVITTGRISAQKNPSLFNTIAEALSTTKFIWVGDGPLREELVAKNIEVTGYVSRKEVFELLSKASVYVQTSLWEGMPVSILEAMATGLPVVASDIIGNRDIIRNGSTGYLCDIHNPSEFTTHITHLMEHEEMENSMGTLARNLILQEYDMVQAVERYAQLYEG
jgi:glycosyltransferase involved in cell wall biosynthesis